ncbi:gamma-glutamyl-gamma-aminobutyrate hydrolase family protein [Streptomyces dangxiongensis]|uniref:Gamma-glutamyl-gamma-aminobutyrate hydrolase family protein n=1 Tax=Streptomyces dangxiongensis TaxID=1442032 RepID=A0A3G2J7S0_9ACTN|nr:gamma-glutamyl-gamma-aminobutyrate hydrolase family protein [Streptomyces dangxiongensis]AYN37721.1 gamma-glutamyl-gamma-aminobutyrate hydrolase family protein [Streptomyces dangxiongensis]
MSRPVIGIAAYRDRARWNIWDTDATVVQQSYVRGIADNGGRPVVLPPDDLDADVLHRLDGLLLTGGADIDPAHYGQEPHPASDTPRPDRDHGELLLLRTALDLDLPVLGVCRGLQLLALVHGGTLHQHLPDVVGHTGHCPREGEFGRHEVRFTERSRAAAVYGPRAVTNSHHHQAVADPGLLTVTGRSDDGVVEAAEDPAKRFVLGVQWHPEVSGDDELFAAFVAACARPAAVTAPGADPLRTVGTLG